MRVSIEQAAELLRISPRLLRARIAKKIAPIRLLGGPGPPAVDLGAVMRYYAVMPEKKQRRPTSLDTLQKALLTRFARAASAIPKTRTYASKKDRSL